MPEKKPASNPSPEGGALRPEELLLASMNGGETADTPSTPVEEDDSLNALLRSALQGTDRPAEPFSLELDTSEFEIEPEEIVEEIVEESAEEIVEESVEEIVEESAEEIVEEIESVEETVEETVEESAEEIVEESAEESAEETAEEPAEEIVEETVEEPVEEPVEEIVEEPVEEIVEETVEEIVEESVEEIVEESAEEIVEETVEEIVEEIVEESAEEIVEEPAEEPVHVAPMPTSSAPTSRERPVAGTPYVPHSFESTRAATVPALSDDRLNGTSPTETMGGSRLARLNAENERLLAESRVAAPAEGREKEAKASAAVSAAAPTESLSDENPAKPAGKTAAKGKVSLDLEAVRGDKRVRDPLQMGLDDVLPPVGSRLTTKPAPSVSLPTRPAPVGYAAAMVEPTPEERALQDTDIPLGLGHETDLTSKKAPERVETLRERAATEAVHPDGDAVVTNRGREYRGTADADGIAVAYVRARRMAVLRLCIAAVGALFGILYDLFGVLTMSVSALTFADTPLYALLGVLWMLAVSVIFLPRLWKGLVSLCRFEPTRYAVAALALPVALMQGIVSACIASSRLFCGVALFTLTLSALAELIAVQGEKDAFSVVSAGKTCHVLTDEPTPAAEERRKTLPEGARVLTAVRTGRVSDYFARTCRYNPYMGRLNYLLPVALLSAIAGAGVTVLKGGSLLYQGISVFTATYLTALPAAYLLAVTLPLTLSNRLLRRRGAAVIGSAAAEEYGGGRTHLIFSDGDALKALPRKDITLRGDKSTAQWKALGDVVFRLLNTPLAVEPVLRGEGLERYRLDLSEQGEGFIRFHLTDRGSEQAVEVLAGTHEALVKRGVRLPKKTMEETYKKSPDSHVLYLAFNRHFHMAYAAEYRVGSTFGTVAEALTALGCGVSLASYDPMTDPDMKDLLFLRRHTEVTVVRPASHEAIRRTRSSGLVATARAADLLHPFAACRRMRRVMRLSHLLCWLGIALSLGITVLAVLTEQSYLLTSAYAVLWQLLAALLSAGLCLSMLTPRSLFLKATGKGSVGNEEASAEETAGTEPTKPSPSK